MGIPTMGPLDVSAMAADSFQKRLTSLQAFFANPRSKWFDVVVSHPHMFEEVRHLGARLHEFYAFGVVTEESNELNNRHNVPCPQITKGLELVVGEFILPEAKEQLVKFWNFLNALQKFIQECYRQNILCKHTQENVAKILQGSEEGLKNIGQDFREQYREKLKELESFMNGFEPDKDKLLSVLDQKEVEDFQIFMTMLQRELACPRA